VDQILSNPRTSLGVGLGIAALLLVLFAVSAGDALVFFSFLFRALHILSAAVWLGLIVFVNFVQLVALRATEESARDVLHRAIVPGVVWWLRHASTATVLTGAALLLSVGYVLPTLIYGSGVYVPPLRAGLLWTAVLGALVMWMFVHMYIWPSMQVVLGLRPGDADARARAGKRVMRFSRLNLVLAVPVMLAMVAAAHLY